MRALLGLGLFLTLSTAAEAACDYAVRVEPGMRISAAVDCAEPVEAFTAPAWIAERITVLDEAGRALRHDGQRWPAEGGRHFRYRVDLGAHAAANGRGVQEVGRSMLTTADLWLPRPTVLERELAIRLTGENVATGFAAGPDGATRFSAGTLGRAGYTVFGPVRHRKVAVAGSGGRDTAIDLVLLDGAVDLPVERLERWVAQDAAAVERFYGNYPVERSMVAIVPVAGRAGVLAARTAAGGGITTAVQLGQASDAAALAGDGLLVRAMLLSGMPYLIDDAAWLMQGIATYLEPLVRARAGWIAPEAVWATFTREMARGQDALVRTGMRRAGFGALSWGGALFMLMTDVEMRRETGGARGLEDCLRAIARDGGTRDKRWTTAAFVAACDKAVGLSTMATHVDLYYHHGGPADLDRLWQSLGVVSDGEKTVLRMDTEAAAIRDAILWGRAEGRRPPPIPRD